MLLMKITSSVNLGNCGIKRNLFFWFLPLHVAVYLPLNFFKHLQYVFGAHDVASKVIEKTGRRVESIVDIYTIRITIMIKAENIK
jgi:hypothetical protein